MEYVCVYIYIYIKCGPSSNLIECPCTIGSSVELSQFHSWPSMLLIFMWTWLILYLQPCHNGLVKSWLLYDLVIAGQLITTMANMDGEESYETGFLGQADEVVQERICDDELILVKGFVAEILEQSYIFLFWERIFYSMLVYCMHSEPIYYCSGFAK